MKLGIKRALAGCVAAVASVALVLSVVAPGFGSELTWTQTSDADTSSNLPAENVSDDTVVSTEGTGRVWTDKSVSSNADDKTKFDVTLSALTSKYSGTISTGKSTDIVLVLDVSRSMNRSYSTGEYNSQAVYYPVYNQPDGTLNTSNSDDTKYYVQVDGEYQRIQYENGGWYYPFDGTDKTAVQLKESPSDTTDGHVQAYQLREQADDARIKSLQSSVDAFIDKVSGLNSEYGVSNKIAVVQFAGKTRTGQFEGRTTNSYVDQFNGEGSWLERDFTRVVSDFTDDFSGLKDKVDSLSVAGETRSDLGMGCARDLLNNVSDAGRDKTVVFFTDGEPTGINDQDYFDSEVANSALDTAYALEQQGVTVYTIGALSDADPSSDPTAATTSNQNVFLNAISSNYPNAKSSSQSNFVGSGTHYAPDGLTASHSGEYFFSAKTPTELSDAFSSIFSKIEEDSGTSTAGPVTFTDKLGDYMEVKSLPGSITAGTKTYTTSQNTSNPSGSYAYTAEDGGTITVTVDKASDYATGDTVTVSVPASVLPAISYDVQDSGSDAITMTRKYANPFQTTYTVGLKTQAQAAAESQDPANYADSDGNKVFSTLPTDEEGNLAFYTNAWTADAADGDTAVNYTASSDNPYYFFTEDTQLYSDENGTEATTWSEDSTYYYKKKVYTLPKGQSSGTATESEVYVSVKGSDLSAHSTSDGTLTVPSGAARLSNPTSTKSSNPTGTAINVLSSTNVDGTITDRLGNNGKLTIPLLQKSVSKTIDSVKTDVNGKMVGVGDTLTYTVQWKNYAVDNDGQSAAAMVKVADTVPTGTSFVSGSAKALDSEGNSISNATITEPTDDSTIITWNLGEQAAGAFGTVSFEVTVDNSAVLNEGNAIKNKATIQVGENGPEIDTNEVTNTVPEKEVEDSSGNDMDGGTVTVGDVLTYTVHYTNDESTASDVTVADTIPTGTEYVKDSAGDGSSFDATAKKLTWTIEDVEAGASGTVSFKVKVTKDAVKDGEGTVNNQATVQIGENNPEIKTNEVTTNVESGDLVISKTVVKSNYSLTPDKNAEFSFTVSLMKANNAVEGEYDFSGTSDGATSYTGTIKSGGSIKLKANGSITIKGLPTGTTWTVSETSGTLPGGFTPTVGTLSGTIAAGQENVSNASFTNTYSASGNAVIQLKKKLVGRDWKDFDSFEFTIEATGDNAADAPMPAKNTVAVTSSTAKDGDYVPIYFGGITYKKPGTYTYEVTENIPDNSDNGITYDKHTAKVTVTVTDNGDGTLEATPSYENGTFENSYTAESAQATINAKKTLTGRDLVSGEFNFKVTEKNASGNTEVVEEASNAADGTIDFGAINYTLDQLRSDNANGYNQKTTGDDGSTIYIYGYTVSEDQPSPANGITQEVSSFNVVVTVTDNNRGKLSAAVTYPDGTEGNTLEFKNSYNTNDVDVQLNGSKRLTADEGLNPPDIDGKFTFTVTGSDGAPMPQQTTVTNSEGSVDFGTIHYTMANVFGSSHADNPSGKTRTKTFTYTIAEQGTVDGVTNDSAQTVMVKVTDNGDGTMTAEKLTGDGEAFTFTNHYTASPVKGHIEATKSLNGRDMEQGEFHFVLTDQNGDTVATGSNDADGAVVMSEMEFTEPGVYQYTLSEVEGNSGGVEYDDESYSVTITVVDSGKGKLELEKTFKDENGSMVATPEFTNTYRAQPVKVTLGANKTLVYGKLKSGQFEFNLIDADGSVLQTRRNTEDGAVAFEALTFDEAGTYVYRIAEVLPADDNASKDGIQSNGITYDQKVHKVKVVVTDDGEGTLTAKVTYDGKSDEPEFKNVNYLFGVSPTDKSVANGKSFAAEGDGAEESATSPDTGDSSANWMLLAAVASAVAAIGAGALRRFKDTSRK
ncbi:MAG: Spy0128 family protein [Coriobacteriales bacterium]